jgi:hypothetical protein
MMMLLDKFKSRGPNGEAEQLSAALAQGDLYLMPVLKYRRDFNQQVDGFFLLTVGSDQFERVARYMVRQIVSEKDLVDMVYQFMDAGQANVRFFTLM